MNRLRLNHLLRLPHLVDGRQKGQLESLFPYRFASFETGCAHSEVSLDLIPVLPDKLSRISVNYHRRRWKDAEALT
jgi:hypothetical protein